MVAALNVGGRDKPFFVRILKSVADVRASMTKPPVPPEAQPFLQYLPTLADWIRTGRRPTRGELSLLRTFAPGAFNTVKALTYEEIVALASPYETDPDLGVYVRLVKSEEGRAWMTAVLADVKAM